MVLNEDMFLDIADENKGGNKRPLKEAFGNVLLFAAERDVNGNTQSVEVDCANKKYWRDKHWVSDDFIRLKKREFRKLLDQLKDAGFKDGEDSKESANESFATKDICKQIDQYRAEIRELTELMEQRTELSDSRKKSITEQIADLHRQAQLLKNKVIK